MINRNQKRWIVASAVHHVLVVCRRPRLQKMQKEDPDSFVWALLELADRSLRKEIEKAGVSVSRRQFDSLSRMAGFSLAYKKGLFYL